ncbi:hypothetical protein DPMN_185082 [Dreissena polymorpha]|uniref:Tyrosine-protein kinase ephrin type A/B receptor-like domain-containing protein n=1 Tax=Dreissena polymorpha TaxID=45954 RepID=A0A9D4DL79_DREPO|nr:hypothetical protein DPMN_185082 [Dreissena polymorpha]
MLDIRDVGFQITWAAFLNLFSFFCNGSTILPNSPSAVCPIGNYCPEGSYEPTPCPSGTIATGTGNSNLTDCEPCKPGNYCTAISSQNGIAFY